jgi:hypothetical protein
MKSPQPVQFGAIHMGMDIDASNPQHNWILEIRSIDGEPNGRNTKTDNLTEQLMALSKLPPEGFRVISRNKAHVTEQTTDGWWDFRISLHPSYEGLSF